MKKILTLFIAVCAIASVQAQTSKEEARRIILGDGGNGSGKNYPSDGRDVILGGGDDNRNSYPSGNRQYEIDQVNRDYEAKIQSIRNNPYLSSEEKERAIRQLEKDRQRKIQQISSNNRNYRDGDDRNNNGKHKGWNKKKKNKNWKKGKKNRDDD